MTDRQIIAILTAVLRAENPTLDGDAAVLAAIAIARGGMGEAELLDALGVILPATRKSWAEGGSPAAEILRDVDYALAIRGAAAGELANPRRGQPHDRPVLEEVHRFEADVEFSNLCRHCWRWERADIHAKGRPE
jgi:hypothetical protein